MAAHVLRSQPILVTGCPRSGTKYIASVLVKLGLDIGHEEMGRDGVSSWCMAVRADGVPYGPRLNGQRFHAVLHQVRNPVDVIPSMSTLSQESWTFVYAHTPCRPEDAMPVRCAKLWYHWNLHAQNVAGWRYRVETLPQVFEAFCARVAAPVDRQALEQVAPNVNTRAFSGFARVCKSLYAKFDVEPPAFLRNHFTDRSVYHQSCAFSWDTLRRLDARTCDNVLSLAAEYGYSDAELRLTPAPRLEPVLTA